MTDPKTTVSRSSLDVAVLRAAWLRGFMLVFSLIATALVIAGCSRADEHKGAKGGFPPAAVTVQEVKAVTVPVQFEYVGQTAGSKEAEVRARVQGVLERRTYQEGGYVKSGQLLFVIDPRPYAAQLQAAEADLARAQAQYAQVKRNFDRVKPLADSNALSRREYDEAVSNEEIGAAAIKQAQARLTEARLNLSYTTVSSPVNGYASRAQKSEGSLVTPGDESLLTTVSQIDPIHVKFSVSEQEQLRLNQLLSSGKLAAPSSEKGGKNGYSVLVRLSDGSTYPTAGKLSFVDTRINPGTGSFDAQAEIPNPDHALLPGLFVRVVLQGAKRSDTILVPQRAVMDSPQGKFVYVPGKSQDGRDVALPRPVTVGDWVEFDGQNQWIVESGLKPGDPVIVEGTAKIFPVPGGSPILLGPPPGAEGKGAPPEGGRDAKGEVKKSEAKK
jgi:membrane fusion protein (multidrug efflux system)